MAERSRPIPMPTGRSAPHVSTTKLAVPVPPSTGGITQFCSDWLNEDVRLEALTLEWSQAEAFSFAAGMRANVADHMRQLERQITRIDHKRSELLDRIVAMPADNSAEAMSKLLVAKRLLEGEGGAEHDIVSDAVARLSSVLGLSN